VRVKWERAGRIGLLVMLVVVLGLYIEHTLSYFGTRSQADQALATVQRLAHENHALERQETSLQQRTTIIRAARSLGMVQPGERSYVIMGKPGGR
jgi:cell division protein FtsB